MSLSPVGRNLALLKQRNRSRNQTAAVIPASGRFWQIPVRFQKRSIPERRSSEPWVAGSSPAGRVDLRLRNQGDTEVNSPAQNRGYHGSRFIRRLRKELRRAPHFQGALGFRMTSAACEGCFCLCEKSRSNSRALRLIDPSLLATLLGSRRREQPTANSRLHGGRCVALLDGPGVTCNQIVKLMRVDSLR